MSDKPLDKTIPGGLTISASGYWQNANGDYIDEHGKLVDEPVYAKDVLKAQEDAEKAAAADAAEVAAADAARQARLDALAADAAKAQADATKADADAVAKAAKAK